MHSGHSELDLLQAARCEDLVYEEIRDLTVRGSFESRIICTLTQSGAHLLEGARGVGKSMLLRSAEIELDSQFKQERKLPVYVNFKTSTLLEGVKAGERDGFQVWVNAKILQALHDKLVFLDLIGKSARDDPYHRIFGIKSVQSTKTFLQEKIQQVLNNPVILGMCVRRMQGRQWWRADGPVPRDGRGRGDGVSIGYVFWVACCINSGRARTSCAPRIRS
jgi:hypothetical protein